MTFSHSTVAAKNPKVDCAASLSSTKKSVSLPEIKPIVVQALDKAFDDPNYQFELKYDGFRGVFYFERGQGCRIVSRSGKTLTQFQSLCDAIVAELKIDNAIFDGEVIAYDSTGRPVFNNLQRRKRPFQYVAFDLMWLNGNDLQALPLKERRELLLAVLPKNSIAIAESLAIVGNGVKMFQVMQENDLEGIVAKRLDDKYSRFTKWYKIKNRSYSQAVGRGRFFDRRTGHTR